MARLDDNVRLTLDHLGNVSEAAQDRLR